MGPVAATASLLLASALWTPLATATATDDPAPDSAMIIHVDVPARSVGPTPIDSAGPSAPGSDGVDPALLPATGGEIGLWCGALALAAIGTGALIRARRRRA